MRIEKFEIPFEMNRAFTKFVYTGLPIELPEDELVKFREIFIRKMKVYEACANKATVWNNFDVMINIYRELSDAQKETFSEHSAEIEQLLADVYIFTLRFDEIKKNPKADWRGWIFEPKIYYARVHNIHVEAFAPLPEDDMKKIFDELIDLKEAGVW